MLDPVTAIVESFPDRRRLGRDEAERVVPLAQAGDRVAITRMIGAVILSIAGKAQKRCRERGLGQQPEDLMQRSIELLITNAIPKFDTSKRVLWLTYANWWIAAAIDRESKTDVLMIDKQIRSYGFREAADRRGISIGQLHNRQRWVSLSASVDPRRDNSKDGKRGKTLNDLLKSHDDDDWLERVFIDSSRADLLSALLRPPFVTAREAFIVYCHLWEDMTLAETGKEVGVTRERIRQIEWRVFCKIRRILETDRTAWEAISYEPGQCVGWPGDCVGGEMAHGRHCDACWGRLRGEATKKGRTSCKTGNQTRSKLRSSVSCVDDESTEMSC